MTAPKRRPVATDSRAGGPAPASGQVVLARYADKLDADGRHALERVRAGSVRMGVLIDSMLELSRLGRRPLEFGDVELSALAGEVVEELRAAEPERDVEVLIESDVSAVGDKELLRVALQNLLGNAFKFTSPKPHASVQFGRTEYAGQAAIFVRDNGVGFDMNDADKLFRPFERLHSESQFSGTGIGLATVQRVIGSPRRTRMGGGRDRRRRHILLHARLRRSPSVERAQRRHAPGATLWLTCPGRASPTIDITAGDLMAEPVTILLVEDNPDDEALTVLALRMTTAANIEVAHDGQEAIDYLVNDGKDRGWCCWTSSSRRSTGSRCCGASAKTSAHA